MPTTGDAGRHVRDHHRVGADARALADGDRTQDLRAGADDDLLRRVGWRLRLIWAAEFTDGATPPRVTS